VLAANFGGVPFEAESGGVYRFDLGEAFISEISRFTGSLERRREFASVHVSTVLLRAAPTAGEAESATPASGQPAEGEVSR
jgi:hypothetical protein